LAQAPNVGDNGMHASASPFEAFAERNNWLGVPVKDDIFGSLMCGFGMQEDVIKAWSVDPQVLIEEGGKKKGSLFDQLEDLDTAECFEKLLGMSWLNSSIPTLAGSAGHWQGLQCDGRLQGTWHQCQCLGCCLGQGKSCQEAR